MAALFRTMFSLPARHISRSFVRLMNLTIICLRFAGVSIVMCIEYRIFMNILTASMAEWKGGGHHVEAVFEP